MSFRHSIQHASAPSCRVKNGNTRGDGPGAGAANTATPSNSTYPISGCLLFALGQRPPQFLQGHTGLVEDSVSRLNRRELDDAA